MTLIFFIIFFASEYYQVVQEEGFETHPPCPGFNKLSNYDQIREADLVSFRDHPFVHQVYKVVRLLTLVFWLPLSLMIYLAVYQKSDQDILQGISKLDYLVKLSLF